MLKKLIGHATLAATLLAAPMASADTLNVSGSTTVAGAILLPMEEAIEAQSGVSLEIVANGSSRGIDDLVNGRAELAMISAPLDVTVEKIEGRTPGSLAGTSLQAHQISETRVAFVVHPSNPVTSMTLDQVTGILNGSVTN